MTTPDDEKLRRALGAYVADLQNFPELSLLFSESQHIAVIPEAERIIANADAYAKTLLAIIDQGIASGTSTAERTPECPA
ncbi:hypothetical protein H7I41_02200 [Mycobacterium manitobense]|uniref:PE domain-containing protein n=1 Tax=[Mycobacterium] manitobense TaxID=190147 RepID=A0A9X2Y6A6_9MYCO|nr:hypothetical protein [[Mycobacterium] manitobense]MCV7168728.1 hypothetical protein [[Mycobacterium] manitobense]